jgi:DNA adenine methylase
LKLFWRDDYYRYVEPFAGSACLFFAIDPRCAVLGDTNAELINAYRALRRAPERLHRRLVAIPREKDFFYRWRSKDPRNLDTETRALRFMYLNHNCFNGIYRTNFEGAFNVPFGSKLSGYPSREDFLACAEILSDVELVSSDFQRTLARVAKHDFV